MSLLLTIYFSLPHAINPSVDENEFLGYHWSNCLVQGVMTFFWQMEISMWQHLPQSLEDELRDSDPSRGHYLALEGVDHQRVHLRATLGSCWDLGQPRTM